MRSLRQIYDEYKIMSNLRDHQLRVASVAKYICDRLPISIDAKRVVETCLFHDMGNIIKFDMGYFPEFNKPEGQDYWEGIKREYIKKYGPDAAKANVLIAREIGLEPKIIEGIEKIGFSKLLETLSKESMEEKICAYSDMRVAPCGVVSIDERLIDGKKRYRNKKNAFAIPEYDVQVKALKEIEKQISEIAKIKPEDITDKSVSNYINILKNYQLA